MKRRRKRRIERSLSEKTGHILNSILIVLFLILFRVWHVAVLQHAEKVEASWRPQKRTVIDRAERATIRDRFGIPLAQNQVQYNAAISYGDIREIPRCVWIRDPSQKKRAKVFKRKKHIAALAALLGTELQIDRERIEDLIHSKASIFGAVPFVVKEDITEKEYYRLKMLEKDWPGIRAECVSKRVYPRGPLGGEVIGYMGAISRSEYEAITDEMCSLREAVTKYEEGGDTALPRGYLSIEAAHSRLKELEGKAYTIDDYVGKTGVEGAFDEVLRGTRGKYHYLADTRGNFLQELEASLPPVSGSQLSLTLSADLQEYAEQLLTEYDQAPVSQRAAAIQRRTLIPEKQPWIKGGAIVVMEPSTGEILALASSPRFNPNDFIRSGDGDENAVKKQQINRWLENIQAIGSHWDLKIPLRRERFDPGSGTFYEEEEPLSWECYLDMILPHHSPVRQTIDAYSTLGHALLVQETVEKLLSLFSTDTPSMKPCQLFDLLYHGGDDVPQGVMISLAEKEWFQNRFLSMQEEVEALKTRLSPYFHSLPLNYEKLLLIDLFRLCVEESRFDPYLSQLLGNLPLVDHREDAAHMVSVKEAMKRVVADLFHENHFKKWREREFKPYLAQKRKEEESSGKKYARPYIEYLDEVEEEMFSSFWQKYQWPLIAYFISGEFSIADEELAPYFASLKNWRHEILEGAHAALTWVPHFLRLKETTDEFDFSILIPYLKTLRGFEELNRPLFGSYVGMRREEGNQLEKHLAAAFYPRYGYGFARSQAFRQAASIGSLFKLVPAYEAMRQCYLAAQEKGESCRHLNPFTMIDDKHRIVGKEEGWNVGFSVEGRAIPMYYRGGRLPRSEHSGVGKVDLVRAIETSSNPYFALLSGEVLEDPEDLLRASNLLGFGEKTGIDLPGEFPGRLPVDVAYNRTGLYALSIGQHTLVGTPLQAAVMLSAIANRGKILKPKVVAKVGEKEMETEVRWNIFLPDEIRDALLLGMKKVVVGEKGTARSLKTLFSQEVYTQIVGKTSTAEAIERLSLDGTSGQLKSKHIWFGAIAFDSSELTHPELVVVVYLRHGGWGWEAAPLAVKVIQKWEELRAYHQN